MAGLMIIGVAVFIAGVIAGGVMLVSVASIREDRIRLSRKPPGRIARAGRMVTGLKVDESSKARESMKRPDRPASVDAVRRGRAVPAVAGWRPTR